MANKKLMTGFEKIILIGCLGFLVFSFWKKKDGISLFERSEEVVIVDGKSSAETYRELDAKEKERNDVLDKDAKTDDIVAELARTFSKGKNEDQTMEELGLSEDEQKFYKNVKEKNVLDEKIESAKDWWNILNASATTYGKFKEMVNEATGKEVKEQNVSELLQDARSANDFYKNLQKTFNISEEEAKAFEKKGTKGVSDWVEFIEKNQ